MKELQKILYKSKSYLKRHSPTILTCIAAIGVVATSVMAVRATPKAMLLINEKKKEKGEELTKLEVVVVAAPIYIPTILVGLSTISCVFGANMLNKRSQASLASAYAMLDQSYKQYRKAANSVYGEDADSKIKAEAAKEIYVSADGYSLYASDLDGSEKVLFYDDYSRRYFTSTMASVINAQYHINRNLELRGDVNLNEFYDFLGIDKIDCGDDIGWSMDYMCESGIMWLDFENRLVKMEDGMECYIISALDDPISLYPEVC